MLKGKIYLIFFFASLHNFSAFCAEAIETESKRNLEDSAASASDTVAIASDDHSERVPTLHRTKRKERSSAKQSVRIRSIEGNADTEVVKLSLQVPSVLTQLPSLIQKTASKSVQEVKNVADKSVAKLQETVRDTERAILDRIPNRIILKGCAAISILWGISSLYHSNYDTAKYLVGGGLTFLLGTDPIIYVYNGIAYRIGNILAPPINMYDID